MTNSSPEKQKSWLMRCKAYWLGEWFDPHTSFLKLPSFQVPFIVFLILFALLCWKVASDNQLVGSWSWTVTDMYEWFKIPFWVLALLIPVLGLLNANHKSEQARAAMELTKSQNNFSNYYKHLEEFTKFVTSVSKEYDPYVKVQIKTLHSKLFPGADDGKYKIFFGNGSVLHDVQELVTLTIKDTQQISKECTLADAVEPGEGVLRKQADYSLRVSDYFVFQDLKPDGVFSSENDDVTLICKIHPYEIVQINQIFVMLKLLDRIVLFDAKTELPNKDFHVRYKNAFVQLMDAALLRKLL